MSVRCLSIVDVDAGHVQIAEVAEVALVVVVGEAGLGRYWKASVRWT